MSGDALLRVYGIGSCDTCRRARRYLDVRAIPYVFHDVREDGLGIQMLERWAQRAGWQKLLNRQSLTWRRIPEADRGEFTPDSPSRRPWLVTNNPAAGWRTCYMASGEMHKTIGFDKELFNRFWVKLGKYMAAKRNVKAARGRVLVGEEYVSGGPIRVQARVLNQSSKPYPATGPGSVSSPA